MTKADEYYNQSSLWQKEVNYLRKLLCDTDLKEEYKWQFPVYTIDNKNVISVASFKDYAGMWFFQGVFLNDQSVLQNAQEGKTKAMRQWRFYSLSEIQKNEEKIKQFILEAIQNQKDGKALKPEQKKKSSFSIPELLVNQFNQDKELKIAFSTLSPSLQREYADYIHEAKRETTKQRRLQKIIPLIRNGKGLNDQYRK